MEYYSVFVLLANIINYIRAKLFYLFSIYIFTQSINYLSTATSRLSFGYYLTFTVSMIYHIRTISE